MRSTVQVLSRRGAGRGEVRLGRWTIKMNGTVGRRTGKSCGFVWVEAYMDSNQLLQYHNSLCSSIIQVRVIIVIVMLLSLQPLCLVYSTCLFTIPTRLYESTSITSAVAVASSSLSSCTVTYLLISSFVMIFSFSTAVVPFSNL